jgi:hypothetical protein
LLRLLARLPWCRLARVPLAAVQISSSLILREDQVPIPPDVRKEADARRRGLIMALVAGCKCMTSASFNGPIRMSLFLDRMDLAEQGVLL